jgi:serine/threonine-protein kinase
MVRRAARECHDMPALLSRLGEQITQATAREAFLGQVPVGGTGTGGTHGTHGSLGPGNRSAGSMSAATGTHGGHPVSDAFLEQAQRVLAAHVGPIAKVVVKRAAERTRERHGFCDLLADAVPEAGRAKLLADLARLG